MQKQALVIGLGQFGMAVASALTRREVEVLAVDVDPERVRLAADLATEALTLDATDEDGLAALSPSKRDVCICAIGEENRDASIICTALLRQFGARMVVARANSDLHARILTLVGAHQTVNPEKEFGERVASQLLYSQIRGVLPLADDILITESVAPNRFETHTLSELQLPKRYQVTVVAVRRAADGKVALPGPDTRIERDDVLVLVGSEAATEKMLETEK
jgi:trk system potassium uptake protein TrkA